MAPILLSRAERRHLARLADSHGHCPHDKLPEEVAAKFLRHRMLASADGDYHLTVRGQIEAVRQHFRLLPPRPEPAHPKAGLLRFPPFRRRAAA